MRKILIYLFAFIFLLNVGGIIFNIFKGNLINALDCFNVCLMSFMLIGYEYSQWNDNEIIKKQDELIDLYIEKFELQAKLLRNLMKKNKLQEELIQELENKENESEIPVYIVTKQDYIGSAQYTKFVSTNKKKAEEYYEKQSLDFHTGYAISEHLCEKETLLAHKAGIEKE